MKASKDKLSDSNGNPATSCSIMQKKFQSSVAKLSIFSLPATQHIRIGITAGIFHIALHCAEPRTGLAGTQREKQNKRLTGKAGVPRSLF